MADVIYNNFKKNIMNGSIDLDTDTIKVALVTSSYTPNQDTDEFFDDVTNEVSATGYTAGGQTLTTPAVTADTTDDEGVFDADDVSWTITGSLTARGAVIYKDTGTPGTSPLICYIDFGGDEVATDGDFDITWNAEGILNLN